MSRLAIPGTIDEAPADSRALLGGVAEKFGRVPNVFRLLAVGPAALEGYAALDAALGRGTIGAETAQRIALAVAEANGCQYSVCAQIHRARNLVGLDDAEITANRNGASNDPTAEAAVRFAVELVRKRGDVSNDALHAMRSAGYDDAQIVEIVAHVALNTLANYATKVGDADIDFPRIQTRKAA